MVQNGTIRNAVVIGVELISRYIDWSNRNVAVLFGDGAGAFVLQGTKGESDIISSYIKADGRSPEFLNIPNGGVNFQRPGEAKSAEHARYVQMNGKAIYEFAVSIVPEAIKAVCQQASLQISDMDHYILHQANERIIKAIANKLSIPSEKLIVSVDAVGNTGAASIPLALKKALASGQIKAPAKCALVGFGGGLTWGSLLINWTAVPKG
mgnify:FL=1